MSAFALATWRMAALLTLFVAGISCAIYDASYIKVLCPALHHTRRYYVLHLIIHKGMCLAPHPT